ncbi:cellulose biosynthesis cyclic di-GMP-binding regulatory protein BcsB [Belliella sp. DSM 111904]|uniref:Cellulose biosynthesis cyclic di-GMP-binding regulatory protein BcsB n=1 Tax=Belliella filtrata TaxID=2923435 RepID=A0ABS9UY70_9BACT|nr:cellulose biosynthesis cyclic di-GMP-binding regulatory protein BcsB [Belliella filtrata]MCH7408894.1 cellulose biosynthesis cyclic di-GMP-binding regulatory protein BcsB [Belliella filtrata]
MAKDPVKRSFTEFGYPKSTISFGEKSGAEFYFKNDPLRDLAQSGFFLEILVSPSIQKEKSKIGIKLDNNPVLEIDLREQSDTIQVFVPLQNSTSESGYTKLSIEPSFRTTNDDCMDIDQKGTWFSISENSYFQDKMKEPNSEYKEWTISEFLPSAQAILIPKANLESYANTISHLHFFFLNTQGRNLSLKFLEDAEPLDFHHAVLLGEPSAIRNGLPDSFVSKKKIETSGLSIHTFEFSDSLKSEPIFLNNLFILGQKPYDLDQLIQVLFTDFGKSVFLNQSLSIIDKKHHVDPVYRFDIGKSYNLAALGLNEEVINGKGRMRKNIPIPEFLAKQALNTISFNISVNHTPIKTTEKAYLNIFINNKLLQTYQLDGNGVIEKTIDSRKAQLGASNYIGFEFIYIPEGGMCDQDAPDFFAQIDPSNSSVSFQYHNKIPETFHAFPANFAGSEVDLIYDYQLTLEDIPNFSKLISLLNLRDTKALGIYLPRVSSLKNSRDSLLNKNLILLSRSDNNFEEILQSNSYVEFSQSRVNYRSDELDTFFGFVSDKPLNYVQLTNNKGNKILKFNLFSKDRMAFERLLDGFREQYLTNTGNVMISNSERYFFFDLSQSDLKKQKSESEVRFISFWSSYRILIISMLAALFIVLLIYIYKKSRFAQKSIEDARK